MVEGAQIGELATFRTGHRFIDSLAILLNCCLFIITSVYLFIAGLLLQVFPLLDLIGCMTLYVTVAALLVETLRFKQVAHCTGASLVIVFLET